MPQAALLSRPKSRLIKHSTLPSKHSAAEIYWRDRPYQQLGTASEIAQISEGALYAAEKNGLLTFVRLAGRTLVETASLVAFLDRAEPWTPSERGAAGRAKRAEIARSALR
ncbi:hypothetical protein FV222_07060 [Methylobacterium sp. WL103]|uniref:hypothetical protein n=1 Tax=Methylobacterium sp. WL103 TaxID=2603891 RepID=UPI0011CAEA29|nr:hypothetical protein [Methylobacterium sp. WL103]TXN04968.1 hypothetical protein FV222_07060 [Methylobacterium sp. WL103]